MAKKVVKQKEYCECRGMCDDAYDAHTPQHLMSDAWRDCPRRKKEINLSEPGEKVVCYKCQKEYILRGFDYCSCD